jgi:alkylation response protein AidB-like acyl-CoA dehydrogenase
VPVEEDGETVGYRITGQKQWISNGAVADLYSILASTDAGPTWFIVERDTEGFSAAAPEHKHGIRLSNTAALYLDDVYVDAGALVGTEEGQGLQQAQQVFGYTRLMVAAFGLGAGWAALQRAMDYSVERIQAGGPLSEKQGYTHKLIVPHAVALEAAGPTSRRPRSGSTRARTATSTPRVPSRSTSPPRPATRRPTPRSRRSAATATPTTTWSRRSGATCASPRSTRAPRRSWR